ncbi:cytidylate kinase [Desulfarculus baarsii DSM 2075]|uniref:Cytidylate kinase n=1 Tax=Desulfarculus baarsii (strain ATCC 33931 / DSM 2075 / LMG 7858 / VKM B-1802 / 2st14) TaxID=644282 RepID=E1QKH4_DESB2|nr:(d)CMP kinase [Desulfarculus baarsii]ADK86067.1 cytidylate kinase [Desulfarculus baarsii DSM 2075]
MIVTIDGPSGAGKTTVSKAVADELGFARLDTGALYRAVGLAARLAGVDADDQAAVAAWLPGLAIDARPQGGAFVVLHDGRDVEPLIRTEEMGAWASKLSAQAAVRQKLLELQRRAALAGDLVCEGRDMGTVVFPAAQAKFFLTARPEVRAARRLAELRPGDPTLTLERVLAEITSRDQRDSSRSQSPLKPAADAVIIDASELSPAQVTAQMVGRVRQLRKGD